MRRFLFAATLASGATLLLSGMTFAQSPCPAGKTANGQCVNASLSAAMTQIANILAQPKLSETAYPVLPSSDADFRYPNQLNPNFQGPAPTTGTPVNIVIP